MHTLGERNEVTRRLREFKFDEANGAMLSSEYPHTPFHRERVEGFWTGHNLFHWMVEGNLAYRGERGA